MSWWKSRSHLSGSDDAYGEATPGAGVNRSTSPPKKSRGKKAADEDYPGYADGNSGGGYGSYNGGGYGGGGGGYNNGFGGSTPYRSGNSVNGTATPYGGGYNGNGGNSNSSYGNNGGGGYNKSTYGHGGDGYDAAGRTPMFINTREVHVYGAPANNDCDDQRRRGGGSGGFFGPAFHAVGHFVDRRFGLDDRN